MPQGRTANSVTHQIRKKIASAVVTGMRSPNLFEYMHSPAHLHTAAEQELALGSQAVPVLRSRSTRWRRLKNRSHDTDVGLVAGALGRLGRDFRIFAGLELATNAGRRRLRHAD